MRDWWVKSGITSSNVFQSNGTILGGNELVTGPCGDATSGEGNYIYAEASGCFGAHFRIRSPWVLFTKSVASIAYSYYLYGQAINPSPTQFAETVVPATLAFYISYDNGSTWDLLKMYNGVENPSTPNAPWLRDTIPLSITVPLPALVVFRIEAVAAGNWYGYGSERVWEADMAIDDVLITEQGASNVTVPYIDPPTNVTSPTPQPPPNNGNLGGGGGGLSNGAIAGIVVGIVAGLCCLCCLLLLLLLLVLLIISPRKPPTKAGKEEEDEL